MSEKDFDFYQKELDEAMRNIAEPVPFVHLTGCDGGPWDFSVTFSGDRQCWRCQTANNAYQQGQQDMLAKCIAVVESLPPITDAYGTSDNAGGQGLAIVTRTWLCNRDAALAALRALRNERKLIQNPLMGEHAGEAMSDSVSERNVSAHQPGCPCNSADERGCFLISADTGRCVSCTCAPKEKP